LTSDDLRASAPPSATTADDPGATYRSVRVRLSRLLDELPSSAAHTPVDACPGWDVHDVVAHLVGIVDDALAGRLSGPPDEEQTTDQVARSADVPVARLVERWNEQATEFEAAVTAFEIWPAAIDAVTHELDIAAALGRDDTRDHPDVRTVARRLLADRDTGTTLQFVVGDEVLATFGDTPPHSVRCTAFEVTRIVLGRRAASQVLAMDWTPKLDSVPPDLFVFGPRTEPLHE